MYIQCASRNFVLCSMRKNSLSTLLLLLVLIASCRSKEKEGSKSENKVDAARNFIRSALDGKFDEARTYMLPDSINTNFMDVVERSYQKAEQATKDGYRSASITILNVNDQIKDSIAVVIYSNTFKNDPDTLKVIKTNGQWLVDFKYLYEHDTDTLVNKAKTNDMLK